MFKKINKYFLSVIAFAFILLADISTSTNTLFLHGEPDCPEELLK